VAVKVLVGADEMQRVMIEAIGGGETGIERDGGLADSFVSFFVFFVTVWRFCSVGIAVTVLFTFAF
jgi:hypothetical protein